MKTFILSAMALFFSMSLSDAAVEKKDVKQSLSDTMKYVSRGFRSCTDKCITSDNKTVCDNRLNKKWCKDNCEHKKIMVDGKEVQFSVDKRCESKAEKLHSAVVDGAKTMLGSWFK